MVEAIVLVGALAGGFVSGLTGFGTGLSSLPFWVQVLPPTLASPLVLVCSVASHLLTFRKIWHALDFRRIAPYALPGIVGIPIGVWLLPMISAALFRACVGAVLVIACAVLLYVGHVANRPSSRAGDAAVGFAGGILGGIAGLSGVLPTIWAQLHGWEKDVRRALFQGYNFTILVVAIAAQGFSGFMSLELGRLVLIALPGTFIGTWLGRRLYDRMDTRRFGRVVLVFLMVAGALLVVTSIARM